MHPLLIAQLLTLLAVANGMPIIVENFLGKLLAFPIDGGATFADGKPLVGSSKTLRGLALSIAANTAVAPLNSAGVEKSEPWSRSLAMLGDLFSSFLKRRMGLAPSCQAIGLDQIQEFFFLPLLACWFFLPLTIVDVVGCHRHLLRRRALAVTGTVQIGDPQPPLLNGKGEEGSNHRRYD